MKKKTTQTQKVSPLETKFLEAKEKCLAEIKVKTKIAEKALKEVCKISEKYGIPFLSNISPISQEYKPASFNKKWGKLFNDMEERDEENGIDHWDHLKDLVDGGIPEFTGWQHSSVC